MRSLLFLKNTGRDKSDLIYLLSTYFLVFFSIVLSIIISIKKGTYDISFLFGSLSENFFSNLMRYCLSNLEKSSFILWILIFSSFTPFGVVIPWCSILFKSYSIGLLLCNLYLQYKIKGIVFGLFVILPGMLASLYSLIFLIPSSTKLSMNIIKNFYPNSGQNSLWDEIKTYSKNMVKSSYILFLSFVLNFLLYGVFLKFFAKFI